MLPPQRYLPMAGCVTPRKEVGIRDAPTVFRYTYSDDDDDSTGDDGGEGERW